MKMLRWSMLLAIIPMIALSLTITGCGGKEEKKPGTTGGDSKGGGDAGKKAADAGKGGAVEAKIDAVLTGKVSYDGKAPEAAAVASMKGHKDEKTCLCEAAVKKHADVDQTWLISKEGGVANVVVILEPVSGGKVDVPADLAGKIAKDTVVLDQPYCAFEPHVVAVFKGQALVVKNSADVTHNTKLEGDPLKNPAVSKTISPKGSETFAALKPQTKPLSVKCDIHPWMSGSVWVFDHPFFAVTKEDGSFEVKNAPSGVELKVSLWHEATGRIEATKMTLKAGDNKANDLKIKK